MGCSFETQGVVGAIFLGQSKWKIASYHSPSTCIDRTDLYNISSIYLFAYIHPAIYPSSYRSISTIQPAIFPPIYLSIHPCAFCFLYHTIIFLYLYLFVHANFHLSSFMFIHLSTCLRFVAGKIPYMLAEVCSWDGYSVLNYHLFYLHYWLFPQTQKKRASHKK